MVLSIRRAEARDVPQILQLIRELAEYEKAPDQVTATEADLLRDGFGEAPRFYVELAEWDGALGGMAFWLFSYSTWQGRPGLYLEDLFVRPALRGRGVGKALLVHLARLALEHGCGRFQWQVLDWNAPAIRFYEALGAKRMTEWLTMRVSDAQIAKIAAQGDEERGAGGAIAPGASKPRSAG